MNENILKLKSEFNRISELGWIKSVNSNSFAGAGITFESLLNKPIESFEIPDYLGIEIKTKVSENFSFINLFSAGPDGSYLFEIKRLLDLYGYPSSFDKNFKVLNVDVFGNKDRPVGYKFLFKLNVSNLGRKVFLSVFNRLNCSLDEQTFWSFDLLEEKLIRKLSLLAFVSVIKKRVNGVNYYKYTDIKFYRLKSFDSFINALENGVVKVSFKIGIFKSGPKYGEINNHGTSFNIHKDHLNEIYDFII